MTLQTRLNVMCKVTGVNVTIEPKTVGIHQILNEIQLTVLWFCWVEMLISGHVYLNILSVPKFVNQILVVDLNELFVCVCSLIVNLYLHSKHSLKMG